jgi:hypothetical protein
MGQNLCSMLCFLMWYLAVLSTQNQGVSYMAIMIKLFFGGGDPQTSDTVALQHFVDVVDLARLGIATPVHPKYKNEQLFGYAERFG